LIFIDWLGILLTSFFLGPCYFVYIFFLSVLQELIRLLVALSVNAQIDKVFIGGLFGFVSFHGASLLDNQGLLILFSGPLLCLFIYFLMRGKGKNPLAIVSLRLGVFSILLSAWQIIRSF